MKAVEAKWKAPPFHKGLLCSPSLANTNHELPFIFHHISCDAPRERANSILKQLSYVQKDIDIRTSAQWKSKFSFTDSHGLTHPQSPLGRRHPYPEFQPLLAQNGWNSQIWKVRSRSEFGANTYNYTTHALPGDSFGASPTRQPVRKPCTNGSCSHIRILASRSTSAGDAVMPETLIGVECVFCSCLSDVV